MTVFDAFRYQGKRALVVGGATGMGAAVTELALDAGAEVVVMDRAEVTIGRVKAIHLDLADKSSIESAVDDCGGPVHALFSCAGVADGTPGIERINFIGHRYLIERMLGRGMLPHGSALGMISSAPGMGWEGTLPAGLEFLAITDFGQPPRWPQAPNPADSLLDQKAINPNFAPAAPALPPHT